MTRTMLLMDRIGKIMMIRRPIQMTIRMQQDQCKMIQATRPVAMVTVHATWMWTMLTLIAAQIQIMNAKKSIHSRVETGIISTAAMTTVDMECANHQRSLLTQIYCLSFRSFMILCVSEFNFNEFLF